MTFTSMQYNVIVKPVVSFCTRNASDCSAKELEFICS